MSALQWTVPTDLLTRSLTIMSLHGAQGNEGLALWFGTGNDWHVQVTHVVEVSGVGFKTQPLFMSVSIATMAMLTDLAESLGVYLVGQIHSHPGWYVDLSELDEAHGIRAPGFLSVVCPHYAQQPLLSWSDCGVHVYEGDRYRRLGVEEVHSRISVGPASTLSVSCRGPA